MADHGRVDEAFLAANAFLRPVLDRGTQSFWSLLFRVYSQG